jgi:hypothetical protein
LDGRGEPFGFFHRWPCALRKLEPAQTTEENDDSTSTWRTTITKTRCRRGSRVEGRWTR